MEDNSEKRNIENERNWRYDYMIFSQIGCTINWVRHYDTNTGDTIFFYHYSTGFYTFNAFSFAYLYIWTTNQSLIQVTQ